MAVSLWVTLAVNRELLELVLMWLVVLAAGNPADAGLDVLHDETYRCVEGGGRDGHERSRVGAGAISVLAGDKLPERVGVLEVLGEHVAHRRRELRHFDDALAIGLLDGQFQSLAKEDDVFEEVAFRCVPALAMMMSGCSLPRRWPFSAAAIR